MHNAQSRRSPDGIRHPTSGETHVWGKVTGHHTGCRGFGRCYTRGECTSGMPPTTVNKAAHCGFEPQRRHHQKSKTRVSVATNFFLKKRPFSVLETQYECRIRGMTMRTKLFCKILYNYKANCIKSFPTFVCAMPPIEPVPSK